MRRGSAFWAVVLILVGALLLLGNLGILSVNVWSLFGPLLLVALGVWILWGILAGPRAFHAEETAIPLEGASRAHIRLRHGAGRMQVQAGAGPGELVAGTFGGGLDSTTRRDDDALDVDMRVASGSFPHVMWPWGWGRAGPLDWSVRLSAGIPLSLDFETGASDASIDLTDLRVTFVRLQTGASATRLTLPANAGHTRVEIRSGAAAVTIRVPSGVAARIRTQTGLAGVTIDRQRFRRLGDEYQSADYDTAANKVDLDIQTGVGAVDVR
jgi:hypothetical protein